MTADEMRRTVMHYLHAVGAGDIDAVLALMSEDVAVEDPVGGPPATQVVGHEQVRRFFGRGFERARPRPHAIGPVCTTAGREAAVSFRLALTLDDRDLEIDVVDVIRFDAAGRIASLRAFWNAAEMRPFAGD